jgi:hypothetical protein
LTFPGQNGSGSFRRLTHSASTETDRRKDKTMPEITAQGKIFRDWEALLGAWAMNAALLPGRDDLQKDLAALLAQARDLKIQQENFQGNRSATTQQLTKAIADGKEVARKIRAFVVTQIGSDSKHLSQFGVPPRQKRGRKPKAATTPPPETPPAALSKPAHE